MDDVSDYRSLFTPQSTVFHLYRTFFRHGSYSFSSFSMSSFPFSLSTLPAPFHIDWIVSTVIPSYRTHSVQDSATTSIRSIIPSMSCLLPYPWLPRFVSGRTFRIFLSSQRSERLSRYVTYSTPFVNLPHRQHSEETEELHSQRDMGMTGDN